MPGNQNRRETASQRQALDNIRRGIEAKKAEAKPINYNEIRERELGGRKPEPSDSPRAKELEKFADFFLNETENLRKYGEDFDLQDSEQPRAGADDENRR